MLVEIEDATVTYRRGGAEFNAVDHASLVLEQGEFATVMGRSGSGKTTLLSLIAGVQRPTSGRITVAGKDISQMGDRDSSRFRNERIGYVPQRQGLLPSLTVLENVLLPTQLYGHGKGPEEARNLLDRLGIGDLSGAFPGGMSGGEQRKASIARSLINGPDLLLADEPTSDLDRDSARSVMELLSGINESGTAVVVVTHEPDAAVYGRRLFYMESGRIRDATDRLEPLRSSMAGSFLDLGQAPRAGRPRSERKDVARASTEERRAGKDAGGSASVHQHVLMLEI